MTLEPLDGNVLQRTRSDATRPRAYATDPPGENVPVSVLDRGIDVSLRSGNNTENLLRSAIVDVICASMELPKRFRYL